MASPRDLRDWIRVLERERELVRVSAEVDPHLGGRRAEPGVLRGHRKWCLGRCVICYVVDARFRKPIESALERGF